MSANTLIVGRIIVGLGIGLSFGTVPVYISEVSPAEARGWQVSLFQLAITVGILLAYVVDYAFAGIAGWRWMFGLAVIPATIFAMGMLYLPESPRWLAMRGNRVSARSVLIRIRGTSDVDAEMEAVEGTIEKTEKRGGISDLFAPSLRPALIVGIGLAIFQQITGINTVIYYAPYHHTIGGNILVLRSDPRDCGYWRCKRAYDYRLDAADRPQRPQALVVNRNWREWLFRWVFSACPFTSRPSPPRSPGSLSSV